MLIRFFEWGNVESVSSTLSNLNIGDKVVVKHQWGTLLGEVIDNQSSYEEITGQIIRKVTAQDLEIALKNKNNGKELKNIIKQRVRDFNLEMKIVEVYLSIDSSSLIVVFTADGRIDFRNLVKVLSTELGKSVRFHQIGSRDEAKKMGGFGICGRELCCLKFSKSLKSITTDMARSQSIAHRGSERLSGLCGRLMCCLSYETKQYEEASADMPSRGDNVKYEREEVRVVDSLILEQKVKVVLKDGKYKIVDLKDIEIIK